VQWAAEHALADCGIYIIIATPGRLLGSHARAGPGSLPPLHIRPDESDRHVSTWASFLPSAILRPIRSKRRRSCSARRCRRRSWTDSRLLSEGSRPDSGCERTPAPAVGSRQAFSSGHADWKFGAVGRSCLRRNEIQDARVVHPSKPRCNGWRSIRHRHKISANGSMATDPSATNRAACRLKAAVPVLVSPEHSAAWSSTRSPGPCHQLRLPLVAARTTSTCSGPNARAEVHGPDTHHRKNQVTGLYVRSRRRGIRPARHRTCIGKPASVNRPRLRLRRTSRPRPLSSVADRIK